MIIIIKGRTTNTCFFSNIYHFGFLIMIFQPWKRPNRYGYGSLSSQNQTGDLADSFP